MTDVQLGGFVAMSHVMVIDIIAEIYVTEHFMVRYNARKTWGHAAPFL